MRMMPDFLQQHNKTAMYSKLALADNPETILVEDDEKKTASETQVKGIEQVNTK